MGEAEAAQALFRKDLRARTNQRNGVHTPRLVVIIVVAGSHREVEMIDAVRRARAAEHVAWDDDVADLGRARATCRVLASDPAALREQVLRSRVVGRISPDDKRRVVDALQAGGSHVAMIGDGVNDVPALKAARLAIAQGTGAQMARSVADLVLASGSFAAVPAMVVEGRREPSL